MSMINQKLTLVNHSVRFPEPYLPNKPEYFGIKQEDFPKKAMTLGKIKCFPDAVQEAVFGSLKDSPINRMGLIRSRLQAFIEAHTFAFMNGMANALPDSKLVEFSSIVAQMEEEFNAAQKKYSSNYLTLCEESRTYWKARCQATFQITPEQMDIALEKRLQHGTIEAFNKRFLFQVIHFQITTPETIKAEEIDPAILAERTKIAQQAGTKLNNAVNKFKQDVVAELRSRTLEMFSNLNAAISEDKWNQKSINTLIRYIDNFKSLNFMNDTELEKFLEEQRVHLTEHEAKEYRKSDSLKNAMKAFMDKATEELKQMEQADKAEVVKQFSEKNFNNRKIVPF